MEATKFRIALYCNKPNRPWVSSLTVLRRRELDILRLYFEEKQTDAEIGKAYSLAPTAVRKIRSVAYARLRAKQLDYNVVIEF